MMARLFRWGMALLFAALAFGRIDDPVRFSESLADYRILPGSLVGLAALYLPWLQMCAAVALGMGLWKRAAALSRTGLTAALAGAQVWALGHGYFISCNDVAGARPVEPLTVVLAFVLLGLCGWLLSPPPFPRSLPDLARRHWPALVGAAGVTVAFYASNPEPHSVHDYTLLIARALLQGRLGVLETPPSWMNEMVPWNGMYYCVLPLGGSLVMLPVALLQNAGYIVQNPSGWIVGLVAAATFSLTYALTVAYEMPWPRRWLASLFPVFGTCFWGNLALGGSWHINSGLGVVGQLMALVFILVRRQPLLAGLGLALAYGVRAHLVLVTPALMLLLWLESGQRRPPWKDWAAFLTMPFLLGCLTLLYNDLRFGRMLEFGYQYLPGLAEDPRFSNGLFSWRRIPFNAREMLLTTWKRLPEYPYWVPTGWGGSIFLYSPYLVFLFRPGARHRRRKQLAFLGAASLLCAILCYCNPGGWQFGYRYFLDVLPWVILILLESAPPRPSVLEWLLFGCSVAICGWGTYLMMFTPYVTV